MAEAAPYLFDREFEVSHKGSESAEAAAKAKLEEHWEQKLAEACNTAFDEGMEAGRAEALQRIEADTLDQVNNLIGCVQKLLGAVENECNDIRRDAIEIASTTANLLADEYLARNPTLNVEALFRDALEHVDDAPHVALTVNDAHAEKIQAATSKIASERGFAGKIVVLGDPETKVGDCCLQWADGGISIETSALKSTLNAIVRKHLDRLAGPAPETGQACDQANSQPSATEPVVSDGPGDMK